MKSNAWPRVLAAGCSMFMLAPAILLFGDARPAVPTAAAGDVSIVASPANIQQFFRDRYQIPDSTRVDAQPMQRSGVPHFYQTVVIINDEKQPRTFSAFLTDDSRCLAIGAAFALSGASEAEIIRCLRQAASLPPAARVTLGSLTRTRMEGFLRSTVTVELGGKSQAGELYVTADRRAGVLGLLLPYRRDFVEQLIDTQNQPTKGAAHAPVTIVEYADLECPGCALFQKFLETEFLPKYGSRTRIIFKEFPLAFHPWSAVAAVANECANLILPSTYFGYRSLIFTSQESINTTNVRDRLLTLGESAGLNRAKLGACLDAKASQGRVQASRAEGETLGIAGTPTFVINGRVIWGTPPPATFYKMVDEALAAVK